VTFSGAVPADERGFGAEYELWYDVWQWYQLQVGTNAANSYDQMSAERELVITAFAKPQLAPITSYPSLSWVTPLTFPPGSTGPPEIDFRGHVTLARGSLRAGQIVGC